MTDTEFRYPRVTPYLLYNDGAAAIEWITGALGFRERFRMADDAGRIGHAELLIGDDGLVMLGTPGGHRSPAELGGVTALVHVYVDDVDAHHAHAVAAGAKVIRELADQDYGDRNYAVEDPEGHHWFISQRLAT